MSNDSGGITDYDVRYRACTATDGDTAVLTCATNPTWGSWTDRTGETASDTATSVTVGSLTNGTAYQVQVRAGNGVGDSEWSASSNGTPSSGSNVQPLPPNAPAAATVEAGNQTLTVEWSVPANNGSPITGYSVRYRITDTDDDTAGTSLARGPTGTTQTLATPDTVIGSLTNGVGYDVQVLARSADR